MATSGANTADLENVIGNEDLMASEIMRMWYQWKQPRVVAESRWSETKKYVYATSTTETTNQQNPWSNTSHRPKLYHIFNNILVNTVFSLFPHRDWLDFVAYDQQSNSIEKLQAAKFYLRTKHGMSGFEKEFRKLVTDWIIYGNCFAGVEYVTEMAFNPETGESEPAYVGPRPYRISPYDIVFNAKASTFGQSPKIVKIRKTMGELENEIQEKGDQGYDMSVVEQMKIDRANINTNNKSEFDSLLSESFQMDGYGTPSDYFLSGHAILHEFYGDIYDRHTGELLKNYVITVADGRYILRMQPLNTFSGKPNIFHSVWKERPDSLWGYGPLENLVGLQYRINHLENAKSDAFDQMLDPDLVFQGDPEIKRVGAATYYFMPEGGDVRPMAPDTTVLSADMQIQQLENSMELYAGAPREAMGIRSPGEKTAFEVDQLATQANRVFEYQTNIFSDFLEDVVNAELEAAKVNLTGSDIIEILDHELGLPSFITITREDLKSNGKVVPVGARESARKSRIAQQLSQFYQSAGQDPEVLEHFPAKKIAEMWSTILDFEELYDPFARIHERMEHQRQTMAAEEMLQEEGMIDPSGVEDEAEMAMMGVEDEPI